MACFYYHSTIIMFMLCTCVPFLVSAKRSWSSKGIKKLTKPEADIKVYVFPCSTNLDEEKFLNCTLNSNRNRLQNCKRKLVIRMVVNSGGEFCKKSDGFIPIDHVIDGLNGRKKRLLNPLTIRIKRESMFQLYDLQLVKSVNAEATEEVMNYQNTANYTGCDTSSSHPTCGFSFYNNKVVQYSEGFCCSCDQAKNDLRQPCDGRFDEGKTKSVQTEQSEQTKHEGSNRSSRDLNLEMLAERTQNIDGDKIEDTEAVNVKRDIPNNKIINLASNIEPLSDSKQLYNSFDNVSIIANSQDLFLSDSNLDPRITVKSFQFEHTYPPLDSLLKKVDFALESKSGVTSENPNTNVSDDSNHSAKISEELLKMLLINKIKMNKIDENLQSTLEPLSMVLPTTLPVDLRNFNGEVGIENDGNVHKEFEKIALSLGNGRPEVSSQLNSGNFNDVNRLNCSIVSSSSTQNNCANYTNNICSSTTDMSRLCTKPTEIRNTQGIKNIEKIVHKLLPLIVSPNITVPFENITNASCSMNGQDSKPKEYEFSLSKEKISNASRNLPDFTILKTSLKRDSGNTVLNFGDEEHELAKDQQLNEKQIKKREANEKQIRGGQNCCEDVKPPCNADPDTYLESAHCLRFSDLWYNVHKLNNPRLENTLTIKIYAKHKTPDKRVCWEHLTKKLSGKVGTAHEVLFDDAKNLLMFYSSDDKVAFSLDCANDYILVPQPLPKRCKSSELNEVSCGGPKEYLVLKENDITFDGEDCDKAGVTYASFARQSHRCQREAGSCLKNQPLQFWRDDKKAETEGKQGQYFLSNFITVSEQAILQNITSNQAVLKAPYYKAYQSHLLIEMNADHIDIISDKSEGQISEVYIDATSEKVTIVKVVVTNLGIASELFGVEFVNCSSPLGPSDFDRPGKDEIPPQHRITYTATICSPNLKKETTCSIALRNVDQEVVAAREIILVRGERCMCVWHCECVCNDYPSAGLTCKPLSVEMYNRAGFPGHLPVQTSANCGMCYSALHGCRFFFTVLFIFGAIKALLGICILPVRVFGLWFICPTAARELRCYLEPWLACYPVMRDCDGFPIHPRTHRRSVRFMSSLAEFALNLFFFVCVFRICICRLIAPLRCLICCDEPGYTQFSQKEVYSPAYLGNCESPCGSPCSSRRRNCRLVAGGESQIFEPEALAAKRDELAAKRVEELCRSYHVFRCFTRPVGGVQSVPGTPYCIRGYFLQSDNADVYEFSPPSPLMQMWQMNGKLLEPQKLLDSAPFHVTYRSAQEVLDARELRTQACGVVINVP